MRWCWLLALTACSTPSPCPSSAPANGAACAPGESPRDLECEYGGTAYTTCTTRASCYYGSESATQRSWTVVEPEATCGVPAASCPAAFGDLEGTACTRTSPDCVYDAGVCGCRPCQPDPATNGFWHCRPWTDVPAGCPVPRPRLGEACSEDGTRCDYSQCCGGPSLGFSMVCQGGYWSTYVDTSCSCGIPACPT